MQHNSAKYSDRRHDIDRDGFARTTYRRRRCSGDDRPSGVPPAGHRFCPNTTGTKMYLYVPDSLSSAGNNTNAPVVVAIHFCTGTAEAYFSATPYPALAEQYGFYVIYPESPYNGTCWDVSSQEALTHGGGADTSSIAEMVSHTISTYGADASRVFVTGSSSGAMMTNVLAAAYPDVFKAATVYSGVPAGCFYTGTVDGWNSTCSSGESIHTQKEWADTALAMYPGYTGPRPKMLIFHGSADEALLPQVSNYGPQHPSLGVFVSGA